MKELGLNPDLLPSKAALLTTTIHGFKNPNAISIKPVYALDITAKAKALFQSALPPKSPECLVLMKEELVIAGTKSNFEATSPNHFTAAVASINLLITDGCGKARLTCDLLVVTVFFFSIRVTAKVDLLVIICLISN